MKDLPNPLIICILFLFCTSVLLAQVNQGQCVSGNCVDGIGKFNYSQPVGKIYEGSFKNGLPNGKGILSNADGGKYSGVFENGLLQGQGTYVSSKGFKYLGNFKDNKYDGYGEATYSHGVYKGNWLNGICDGQGIYIGNDGTKYNGNFKNNKYNGYGEATYSEGTYKGNWVDGNCEGEGKVYDVNMNLTYSGKWSNNKMLNPENVIIIPKTVSNVDQVWENAREKFHRIKFKGKQEQTINGVKGSVDIIYELHLYTDYSISGSIKTTVTISDVKYSATNLITGDYYTETKKIHISFGSPISSDTLPNGLFWSSKGFADGKVYKNADHLSYFVIDGKTNEGYSFQVTDY